MRLYAVVFDPDSETTPEAIDNARSVLKGNYITLCSNVLLAKSELSVASLAERLRLSRDRDYTAIVFHLDDQFAGYYYAPAWDWLQQAAEEVGVS